MELSNDKKCRVKIDFRVQILVSASKEGSKIGSFPTPGYHNRFGGLPRLQFSSTRKLQLQLQLPRRSVPMCRTGAVECSLQKAHRLHSAGQFFVSSLNEDSAAPPDCFRATATACCERVQKSVPT